MCYIIRFVFDCVLCKYSKYLLGGQSMLHAAFFKLSPSVLCCLIGVESFTAGCIDNYLLVTVGWLRAGREKFHIHIL